MANVRGGKGEKEECMVAWCSRCHVAKAATVRSNGQEQRSGATVRSRAGGDWREPESESCSSWREPERRAAERREKKT